MEDLLGEDALEFGAIRSRFRGGRDEVGRFCRVAAMARADFGYQQDAPGAEEARPDGEVPRCGRGFETACVAYHDALS